MKSTLSKLVLSSTLLLSSSVFALDIDVKIINVNKGIWFTPLLVSAHKADAKLFTAGQAASVSLQKMAEGGDISGLVADLNAAGANSKENPASGLLVPGASTTTILKTTTGNDYLSIAAMLLPTNDGFVAMNSVKIPTTPGVYKYELNAHDAGTEANNETINGAGAPGALGIPADPSGTGGTGATGLSATAEGFVHIHRGNVGDFSTTGGVSDLNAQTHRFLNPVASVIVTVK